eukprot:jgi/Mesvir1/15194/Mv06431-RA.1
MLGPGLQSLLKEGHQHISGLDEAVLKNIDACKQLSQITRTSLGPHGMNKMIINHLDKLFVTSDSATIMSELEVQHPAAKLIVLAAKAQQSEVGDGANLVVSLAGELLQNAESLLCDGLHTSEVINGYNMALRKVLDLLGEAVIPGSDKVDVRNVADVVPRLKSAIAAKQFGREEVLAKLVAEACNLVCPKNPGSFNVDNVRMAKVVGGNLNQSLVVKGLVLTRDAEGTIKHVSKAKVAVFASGFDTSDTETKGTVLIQSANQLENYIKSEENKMEEYVKGIVDAGVGVVVSGGTVGEIALHFLERYKVMCLKIPSKFELRRFCRATGSTALVKIGTPTAAEMGFVDSVTVEELGGRRMTVVRQESTCHIATIVVHASTENILDDIERAIDDGVNTYKALCKDARVVPGAGATEIEIGQKLAEFGRKETGLSQYAIAKFAEAMEVVPRTLAENAGLNATDVVSALYAAHSAGNAKAGVDITGGSPTVDAVASGIMDLYTTKYWAIKLAVDAVVTVLRVDQIIMSKQAGGPKKPAGAGDDDD